MSDPQLYVHTTQLYTHTAQCMVLTNAYGRKIPVCSNPNDFQNLKFPNPVYDTWDHWKYMEPINENKM